MKNLVLALALGATLTLTAGGLQAFAETPAAPASAPSGQPAAPPSPEKLKEFMKELQLAPPQAFKIGGILKDAKDKKLDPQTTLQQVMNVLSKEQQSKLQALISQLQASPAQVPAQTPPASK